MGVKKTARYYNEDNQSSLYNEYYGNGNAVRILQPERPKRKPQEETQRRSRQRAKPEKELSSIGKLSCVLLTVAIVMTLFICVDYIASQTEMSRLNKSVIQTEKELNALREDNRIKREQLSASLDLNRIYDTAISEYGMVRPNSESIILFESTLSEFVKQYEEIPGATNKTLLAEILK